MTDVGIDNFTPNEAVDSVTFGAIVEMVGYVDEIESDTNLPRSKYHKFLVNNGRGRRVQVVAWNELIPTVQGIINLYTVVHVRRVVVSKLMHPIYNLGNVNYELLIQSESIITTFAPLNDDRYVILTTIRESVEKKGFKIRVEGYMKTKFHKKKKSNGKYYLGCITDGLYQLDLKVTGDPSPLKLRVGQAISVIGVVDCKYNKPPRLEVEKIEHIKPLEKGDLPLSYVYLGNRYPNRNVKPPKIKTRQNTD